MISKKSIVEEIVHDTEKNTKNVHNVTPEHDKDSPKDHFTPTTLGSSTWYMKNNIKMVVILGNSMIEHVNGWKISKKLPSNTKVHVNHFSGAKARCMKDYSKPSLRDSHEHFILNVG